MRIRVKLQGGFAAMSALAMLVGGLGLYNIRELKEADILLFEGYTVPLSTVGVMIKSFEGFRVNIRDAILADDPGQIEAALQKIDEEDRHFGRLLDEYEPSITDPRDRAAFKEVQEAYQAYGPQLQKVADASRTQPDEVASSMLKEELGPAGLRLAEALDDLAKLNIDLAREVSEGNQDRASTVVMVFAFVLVFVVCAGIGIGWTLSAKISRQLASVGEVLRSAAKGDLTVRMRNMTPDEIGEMGGELNTTLEAINKALSSVGGQVQQLNAASGSLNSLSLGMSSAAEETSSQATTVSAAAEEVSATMQSVASGMEEMGATVSDIAKNAQEAARVAAGAVHTARETQATVAQMADSSAQIEQVLKVITAIADQTNLLALNATIEAARAGDAGKGFAVVANEVKELAKQTAHATEEIASKIEAIRGTTRLAGTSIGQITSVMDLIHEYQNSIAAAVQEQSATTSEIGRNVQQVAQAVSSITVNIAGGAEAAQEGSRGAYETRSASTDLAELAKALQGQVAQFRV